MNKISKKFLKKVEEFLYIISNVKSLKTIIYEDISEKYFFLYPDDYDSESFCYMSLFVHEKIKGKILIEIGLSLFEGNSIEIIEIILEDIKNSISEFRKDFLEKEENAENEYIEPFKSDIDYENKRLELYNFTLVSENFDESDQFLLLTNMWTLNDYKRRLDLVYRDFFQFGMQTGSN